MKWTALGRRPANSDSASVARNMSRAYFQVEGQDDELGVFILRTTSFNSLNYLGTRLAQLSATPVGASVADDAGDENQDHDAILP